MGGAMLTGWLAGGLDARRVVVVEPTPSDEIKALAAKGVQLNPKQPAAAETVVVAVKPQTFREAGPMLKPFVGASTLVVSILPGANILALAEGSGGVVGGARGCRRRRGGAGADARAARGGRGNHRGGARQEGQPRAARHRRRAAARHRLGGVGRGREADGCGDRRVRLRPGLRLPAR